MSIPPKLPEEGGGASKPLEVILSSAPPRYQAQRPSLGRQFIMVLLNLCLWLFLAGGLISLLDDSLVLFLHVSALTILRMGIVFFGCLMAVLVYCMMGLTPLIPKRLFLPTVLFTPVVQLVYLPCLIYSFNRMPQVAWVCSLSQVILGLLVLYYVQGALQFRWSLIGEHKLGTRKFSWGNSFGFLFINVCVLLPAVLAYLLICAALALGHFTDGFVALRPEGLKVQVRKYVRDDGKTVRLIPMIHVGDAEFYRNLNASIPTNAIVLLEGVSDRQNLLTNHLSYKRMANGLGLTEQKMVFKPHGFKSVRADIDVEQFAKGTVDFLNMIALIYSRGVNAQTVPLLLQDSSSPEDLEKVMEDILVKRNQHLLDEIQTRLAQWENLVVPWGAAHMPGIEAGIQRAGFHLDQTQEVVIIRFGSRRNQSHLDEGVQN